jgi:hypothetical protein
MTNVCQKLLKSRYLLPQQLYLSILYIVAVMLRLLLHSSATLLQKYAFLFQSSNCTLVLYQLVFQPVDECALESQLFLKPSLLMH